MDKELQEGQRALEEKRRTTILTDDSSLQLASSRKVHEPDYDSKPENRVCPDCGFVEEPSWDPWNGQWVLYTGLCRECIKQETTRQFIRDRRANILRRYEMDSGVRAHMTLANYYPDPEFPSQARAKAAIEGLIEKWKAGMWSEGLMLMSKQVGIGKTHLAVAAACNFVMLYPHPGDSILTIWDMPSYVKAIKSSYDNGGTGAIQDSAIRPALLVMDDIGAEYARATDWYKNLLYDICNPRWVNQRATIVTTNLEIADLRKWVGDRVFSRLLSMTGKPVEMLGDDFRLKQL
jgi:DNA replication protein DnaC